MTVPATVALIVDGGRCLRPGPSLRALFADVGNSSCGRVSPGKTIDDSMVYDVVLVGSLSQYKFL